MACLLIGYLYVFAQEEAYYVYWTAEQADSVKRELRISANDTLRMKMARSLGIYHQEINRDTSLFYTHIQLALAKKLHQPFWETDAYEAAGWLFSQFKNYSLSIEYLLTALRMARDKKIEKNIWQISFFSPNADPTYVRLTTLGFVHNDLSQLYNQTGDMDNELAQLRSGIEVGNQIGNNILLALLKSNLAQLYGKKNQPDSVIYYGQQSLAHMQNSGYKTYEGYQLTMLGDAYTQKGDFARAKSYLDQSVIANTVNRSVIKLPDAYFSYATMYKLLNQPDSSIAYLNRAVTGFTFFDQSEKVKRAYGALYAIYKEGNQPDSAYHYLQLYQSLSDSLNEQEKKQIHRSQNIAFDKQIEQQQLESRRIEKANTNQTYAFLIGIAILLLIAFLLLRNNQTRKKANILLQQQKAEIEQQKTKVESTLAELKATQAQLIQSEKMASLGELTAGIAHEIQNPLNFVNNFSELSSELIEEMNVELNRGDVEEAKAISADIKQNLEKINHHGKRADAIVKGMLEHSRAGSGEKEPTDINALADEYLRLAYHGFQAKDPSFNATLKTDFDQAIGSINIIPQDIGRVLLNLINNALYAVNERSKVEVTGYEPVVMVSSRLITTTENSLIRQSPPFGGRGVNSIIISVKDNGNGIPQKILDKIFQPFFTTKPTGQGTGLGLSLAYDIVKAHGGELKVETREGEGSEFIIALPVN